MVRGRSVTMRCKFGVAGDPYNQTGPLWRAHFQEVKLHDDRPKGARQDLIITTDESWAKIVRANESIIVFDSKTEQILLVVLRNFCGSQKVLD
jgi:hypothetical protein